MNLPTILTVMRIFLVPFLVVVLLAPPWKLADSPFFGTATPAPRELLAAGIFLLASISDILDGYLARRRNEVTTLGTLLDPIADKLLVTGAFISLVEMGRAPAWMVVIITGREFVVSGLRSVLASHGVVLPASPWGKLKMVSQAVAIVVLIFYPTTLRWAIPPLVGVGLLWISMLFALGSAAEYIVRFFRLMPDDVLWTNRASEKRKRESSSSGSES